MICAIQLFDSEYLSSCNITRPQGPRVHLPVTYFLFRDTTFHLVLAPSASLRPEYGTPYLFTSANPKHTLPSDVILRRTTLFQPISPLSGPCNAPGFSSETLALYKSLTYLLTSQTQKRIPGEARNTQMSNGELQK